MKKIKIFIMISIVSFTCSWGSPVSNLPVTITQLDGTQIACFATGDEYYNWLHDKDGYTIVKNPNTGYYCYAILAGEDLIASPYIVGEPLPKSANIKPYINISGEKIKEKVNDFLQNMPPNEDVFNAGILPGVLKTLNNIVIYIRFADQTEFPADQNFYTSIFNDINPGVNSMRGYFQEATYYNWNVISHFYPVNNDIYDENLPISNSNRILSYKDPYSRGYYCPWSIDNPIGYQPDEGGFRRNALLRNAVNYIKNQVPTSLNIDYDNNGCVDNVCFIIRGDHAGTIFWPHKSILSPTVYINEKRVYYYNLQIESFLKQTGTGEAAVLCHEMCHTFGLPDLYHYNNDQTHPVGLWDVMGMPWNPVQHMCAYMKYKYGGWIPAIPPITTSGTYTLHPLATSSINNCYKITIKGSSQYLVVEYRQKRIGIFDGSIPGSEFGGNGLIIYRINEAFRGNAGGSGFGGVRDEVYVFRPDENISFGGDYRYAYFSEVSGRTILSNHSNPYCFIVPNGDYGNIYIKNVRENSNNTLSFDVRFCDDDNITYSNTSYLPALTNASNCIQTVNTVIVKNTDNVTFEAGNEVILNSGFEVKLGGSFEININECGEK